MKAITNTGRRTKLALVGIAVLAIGYLGWSYYQAQTTFANGLKSYLDATRLLNDELVNVYRLAGVRRDPRMPDVVFLLNASRASEELNRLERTAYGAWASTLHWTEIFVSSENGMKKCRSLLGGQRDEYFRTAHVFLGASMPSLQEFQDLGDRLDGMAQTSKKCELLALQTLSAGGTKAPQLDDVAKEVTAILLTGAKGARTKVGELAEASGSLNGTGKGLRIEPIVHPKYGEFKWIVQEDGSIRGWNTNNSVEFTASPTLQGGKVIWKCSVYPTTGSSNCGG